VLRIRCPWCGERDETEFRYRGDASLSRPPADADPAAFTAYVYTRENLRDWHVEWWLHVGSCRKLLKVVRHTVTHEIHAVGGAEDLLSAPEECPPR
jgi:heterotetrameric sarcosine oxidase delta subunit